MKKVRGPQSGREGFVLITSLLLLVVVSALGAGAVFLTITNLRIAENARTGAVARYNAERGLDVALLTLAREYSERSGSWPTQAQLAARVPTEMVLNGVPLELDFDIVDLRISLADPLSGVVEVEGRGGGTGVYRTSARFRGTIDTDPDENVVFEDFPADFVTPGQLIAHGNAKFGVNVHVGDGITATGQARLIDSSWIRSATSTCAIGSGRNQILCEADAEMPSIPVVSFGSLRDDLRTTRPTCTEIITTDTFGLDVSTMAGATICVVDGVTLEIVGNATELFVIGEEDSTVVVRANATPPADDAAGVGLKVAAGTVSPAGPGVLGIGENTIVSKNSINLERDVFVGQDGIVRTYVATEGDIRFAGAGNQVLYGFFHANGDVCTQGTLSVFYGSILAGTDRSEGVDGLCGNFTGIDFRGNGALDAFRRPAGTENRELPRVIVDPETIVGGVFVVARE